MDMHNFLIYSQEPIDKKKILAFDWYHISQKVMNDTAEFFKVLEQLRVEYPNDESLVHLNFVLRLYFQIETFGTYVSTSRFVPDTEMTNPFLHEHDKSWQDNKEEERLKEEICVESGDVDHPAGAFKFYFHATKPTLQFQGDRLSDEMMHKILNAVVNYPAYVGLEEELDMFFRLEKFIQRLDLIGCPDRYSSGKREDGKLLLPAYVCVMNLRDFRNEIMFNDVRIKNTLFDYQAQKVLAFMVALIDIWLEWLGSLMIRHKTSCPKYSKLINSREKLHYSTSRYLHPTWLSNMRPVELKLFKRSSKPDLIRIPAKSTWYLNPAIVYSDPMITMAIKAYKHYVDLVKPIITVDEIEVNTDPNDAYLFHAVVSHTNHGRWAKGDPEQSLIAFNVRFKPLQVIVGEADKDHIPVLLVEFKFDYATSPSMTHIGQMHGNFSWLYGLKSQGVIDFNSPNLNDFLIMEYPIHFVRYCIITKIANTLFDRFHYQPNDYLSVPFYTGHSALLTSVGQAYRLSFPGIASSYAQRLALSSADAKKLN